MYEKILALINYILRHDEKDEETTESINMVKVIENQDRSGGVVRVEAAAPSLRQFQINALNTEVLKETKFDLLIHFGDYIENNFYLYTATYNNVMDKIEIIQEIEDPFINDCHYYLSFEVTLGTTDMHNIAPNLKEYVNSSAEKFPNIHMIYTDEPKDVVKMISEGIGDVIKYSNSADFRRQVFEMLEVDTSDAAVDKLKKLFT